MPRKQNGFGSTNSFSVKSVNNAMKTDKVPRAAGAYPKNRKFGTTITRTPSEQFNIESKWKMWRKGYELYTDADSIIKKIDLKYRVYSDLVTGEPKNGLLFGFECNQYPTKMVDNAVRYVVQRNIEPLFSFGTVTGVDIPDDPKEFRKRQLNKEVWTPIGQYNQYIQKLQYERFRNELVTSETPDLDDRGTKAYTVSATLKSVYTDDEKPAIFKGMTDGSNTENHIKVDAASLKATEYVQENDGDLRSLIGQAMVYTDIPAFLPKDQLEFEDDSFQVKIKMSMSVNNCKVILLDVENVGLENVLLTDEPKVIYVQNDAEITIDEEYYLLKEFYQPYWGNTYFSADVLKSRVDNYSINVPPLYIKDLKEEGNTVSLITVPYESSIKLHTVLGDNQGYLIWSDFSFNKKNFDKKVSTLNVDTDVTPPKVTEVEVDKFKSYLEVDPYFDQTWVNGDNLYLDETFACNCPSYSKAMVRYPQQMFGALGDDRVNMNRQRKYPLPSSLSNKNKEGFSQEKSGIINSWKTSQDNLKMPICKHTIAEMFEKNIRVVEPKSTPIKTDLDKFTESLRKDRFEEEINVAGEREEISPIDLLFSISQLVQLSEAALGSIAELRMPFIADVLSDSYNRNN